MRLQHGQAKTGVVLTAVGIGTALSLLGDSTMYTVLPTHTQEAGILLAHVGVMLGINRAIRILFNNVAGMASDRFPRRLIFVPSLFLGALSTFLCAIARGVWPLLLARMLWGVAWSGIAVAGTAMILDVTQARNRGKALGIYQTWFFVGIALGALCGGFFTDQVGFRAALWIGGAISAVGGLIVLIILPETRDPRRPGTAGGERPAARDKPIPHGSSKTATARSRLWAGILLYSLHRFLFSGVLGATFNLLINDRLAPHVVLIGASALTGVLTTGRTVLSMILAPLIGTLSDRLRQRWKTILIGLGAAAASMLCLGLSLPLTLLIGVVLAAVAQSSLPVTARSLTGDFSASHRYGKSMGWLNTAGDIAGAIGPPLAYLLMPALGLEVLYLAAAVLFAACFALFAFLRNV